MLNPTPDHQLTDATGRPYFLWDCEMTLDELESRLNDPDPATRAYLIGKIMRQAKPDDVFRFVNLETIGELWSDLQRYLGSTLEFWRWILTEWKVIDDPPG
jgi:hypothetical protein